MQEFRKCLLDDCVEMISSNLDAARDKQITVDFDAFSFVIIANPVDGKMEVDQKLAIKKFFFLFGTKWSAVTTSPTAIGAEYIWKLKE